jgi:hypothetical protein
MQRHVDQHLRKRSAFAVDGDIVRAGLASRAKVGLDTLQWANVLGMTPAERIGPVGIGSCPDLSVSAADRISPIGIGNLPQVSVTNRRLFDKLIVAVSNQLSTGTLDGLLRDVRFELGRDMSIGRDMSRWLGGISAYSLQTNALAGYIRTAEIDWHASPAPGATDLVAPASESVLAEDEAALAIFPPDLIEADPLGSDLEVDVFVVRSQAEAQLFLKLRSPRAADRLAAANKRLAEGDAEALAQALTSCRRALSALADDLYPPRKHEVVDRSGKPRRVGQEEFVNRLLMFLSDEIEQTRLRRLAVASLDSTAKSLDALIGQLGKGVHADVAREEASAAYVATWSFIAHVARLTRS